MPSVLTTFLEMTSPHELRAKRSSDERFSILRISPSQWQLNRFMYGAVGQYWSWRDKLNWSDEDWQLHARATQTFVAYYDGSPAGYFELRAELGQVEIVCLGMTASFVGRGFGGPLLTRALEEAWTSNPARVWTHTCTLDHPTALRNYLARGMSIYKVESAVERCQAECVA